MINPQDALFAAIKGNRHKYYEQTVKDAIFYRQIFTGESQDELIVGYKPRETDLQKEQRIRLYHGRTKDVCSRIQAPFDKVGTAEHRSKLVYTDNSETKQQQIALAVSDFSLEEKTTLQQYLIEKCKYYNFIDPNAWLVVLYSSNESGVKSYPMEFAAESVLDYRFIFGVLEYVVVTEQMTVRTSGDAKKINTYYCFAPQLQLFAMEAVENARDDHYSELAAQAQVVRIGDKSYYLIAIETPNVQTPCIRFGYKPQAATENKTFAAITDAASLQFKDLINVKSEYDLSRALHTFLQKIQYAEPCTYSPANEPYDRCQDGTLSSSRQTCPNCKGSGVKTHTTSQDVLYVKRTVKTDAGDMIVPITDYVAYVNMPFDIVNHQSQSLKELPKDISVSIFGIDINTRPNGNVTATEISNFDDALNAVLYDYAKNISVMWEFCVNIIAQQHGISENLIASHQYNKDFRLLTDAELIQVLNAAKLAGASYEVIESYENRLIDKQYPDNMAAAKMLKLRRKFIPFKTVPQSTIDAQLSLLPATDKNKMLYLYNDVIFADIEANEPDFALMPYAKQAEVVDRYTMAFIEKHKAQPLPSIADLNGQE